MQESEKPRKYEGKSRQKDMGGLRIPHAATALVGKGTPSIPPEEAVGAYASGSTGAILPSVPQEPLAQGAVMRESTPDRSRSRDPPRDNMPQVPVPGQAVMNVPDYLLPIMALGGVGHLSLDQPRMRSTGGATPPRRTEANANPQNIRDFFETFNQAEVQEEQVRAIQKFTAGLRDVPQMAGSMPRIPGPASAESADGTTSSAPANPITIVPPVLIPAPVAVEAATPPPAPEVTSDAETLPLPGLPGTAEEQNVPSRVEEEVERTMDDPYVTAFEGVTLRESAPTETTPVVTPTEHMGASSPTFTGTGGLMADIPLPTVTDVTGTTTKSGVNPTEPVSKDTKEATSSQER